MRVSEAIRRLTEVMRDDGDMDIVIVIEGGDQTAIDMSHREFEPITFKHNGKTKLACAFMQPAHDGECDDGPKLKAVERFEEDGEE